MNDKKTPIQTQLQQQRLFVSTNPGWFFVWSKYLRNMSVAHKRASKAAKNVIEFNVAVVTVGCIANRIQYLLVYCCWIRSFCCVICNMIRCCTGDVKNWTILLTTKKYINWKIEIGELKYLAGRKAIREARKQQEKQSTEWNVSNEKSEYVASGMEGGRSGKCYRYCHFARKNIDKSVVQYPVAYSAVARG